MNTNKAPTVLLIGWEVGAGQKKCMELLEKLGYHIQRSKFDSESIYVINKIQPGIVFIELTSGKSDSIATLESMIQISPQSEFVVIDNSPSINAAKRIIQLKVFDYIENSIIEKNIMDIVRRLGDEKLLRDGNSTRANAGMLKNIIGRTAIIRKLCAEIIQLSQSDTNIMISGESGTGKELIARALHDNSKRRNHRFVPVDCSALPENLLENELFGHEQGSFTGATKRKYGLLEYGNKGTCFFDEITEMSKNLQAKLLRVLQEREFRRLGANNQIKVDIRVISATNRDPEKAVQDGIIREDLYYRLRVVPIRVPALRDRKDDIPLLCDYFLDSFKKENDVVAEAFSLCTLDYLKNLPWPGNIRELKGLVERLAVTCNKQIIEIDDLPQEYKHNEKFDFLIDQNDLTGYNYASAKQKCLEQFQVLYFTDLYNKYQGNISQMAREARLSRSAIYKILESIDIN